jgi:PAS domain S-box-containing protein
MKKTKSKSNGSGRLRETVRAALRTKKKRAAKPLAQGDAHSGKKLGINKAQHHIQNEQLAKLASFPAFNPNPVIEATLSGQVTFANPAVKRLFPDLVKKGAAHPYLADWQSVVSTFRKRKTKSLLRETAVGDVYYQQNMCFVEETQRVRIYGFDITERKRAQEQLQRSNEELLISNEELRAAQEATRESEKRLQVSNRQLATTNEELHRVNRTLNAMRKSSQAMFKAVDEAAYLEMVCKIIVEDCGHKMVWIGYAEEDEQRSVRPVAYSGFEEGYLETLKITWADTERGRGPTGMAIRTGKVSKCPNMLTDPKFEPWRKEAIKRGYASSIVLPLKNVHKTFGALSIYSKEPDPFSEDEVKLLTELANDLAYGITTMRLRAEHARAEETLLESEERLKRAQEIAHLGSWELDLVNNRLTWSDEAYRIFGLKPQEFGATYEAFLERVHPDDRAAVDEAYSGSLRKNFDSYEIEHRIVRKVTGEVRVVHEKCEHFRNAAGKIIRSIGMVHDITEHKQAESNQMLMTTILRTLNRGGELHTIIREVLGIIKESTGFDAVGLRLHNGDDYPYYEQRGFSNEFILKENFLCAKGIDGSVAHDANGRVILECTCGVVLSGRADASMPCFTDGGSFWTNKSSELLALEPEADPRTNPRNRCIYAGYQSVGLFPVRSGEDTIGLLQLNGIREGCFTPESVHFFENLADNIGLALKRTQAEQALRESELRERQRAKELERLTNELEHKNEELESIIRIASHDLRSPLMNIKGFSSELTKDIGKVQEMLKEVTLPEKVSEKAEKVFTKYVPEAIGFIHNSADSINRMLKSLMDVTKAGTVPINIRDIDVNVLLAKIAANIQFKLKESGCKLEIEPLPPCRGDTDQVTQVLTNLIENAINYREPSRPLQIQVYASAEQDKVTYCVEDNGKGIAKEHLGKVFELFARLHPEAAKGEGLGLTIAKRMLERQGGKIWANSEVGKGSKFFITLPR